ncbi:putative 2OG-Fe(II) oxygenase [Motiliproteus sp. MSK22-1]|uniref:putative 2OG-Fe(II) oxygenase n=1 Tax=Motiliproteus sp. MSK22-1 TaxID=1897630 RepID=UPI0009774332|nr:putative 2OG-Fe(II) oxygenase [Motiliproteus sp. MSK22-1]OMH32624.1 hypothetical protein BGP75_13820 [Motiliproteus sp. MSK22-1]
MTDDIFVTDTPEIEPVLLWQTECYVCTNPTHSIIKDELRSVVYADVRRSEVSIKSDVAITAKHQVKESELDFLTHENPNVELLNQTVTELITTIATEVNRGFWPEQAEAAADIIESWYHVTQNGGYHDAHSHPNCSWCGIYYLDIGDAELATRNGVNRFYDPRNNADQYLDAGSQYLNSTGFWDIEPKEGQIIIFPSYLKHSALPYFGEKDRIVIAFNAQVHFV